MPKKENVDLKKLSPGSPEAIKEGCECPIMDNRDMPEDLKVISSICKIHWKTFFPESKKKKD